MTMSSDPNQDGFEFAGDPEEPDPAGAIFDEEIPGDDDAVDDAP
jgi:hypothetical protein